MTPLFARLPSVLLGAGRSGLARLASTVAYEQQGKVGVLTLSAPGLNALTVDMGREFARVLDAIDWAATNVLILRGAGKAFSSGGDLDFLRARAVDSGGRNAQLMRNFYGMFLGRVREVPVPTIAAIHGSAVGAGLCLAVGCDLRIAAKTAKMGVSFTAIGLHPGMGSTHMLPRLVGPQLAARLCLTGELISGEEAARIGLVLEAVEEAQVMPAALALAQRIAANAPVAVRGAVRSLRLQSEEGLDRSLWREADAQSYCYAGPDLLEGVEAVAGKRRPAFTQAEGYSF